MGYRHYFFIAKKEDIDKIKNLSLQEIKNKFSNGYDYVDLDDVIHHEEIFGFGKLYYEDTDEQIYNQGKPLFNQQEVMDYFDYYTPYVVGRDGILTAIKIYADKTKRYYKDILVDGEEKIIPIFGYVVKDEDIKSIDKVKKEIQDKVRMWEHFDRFIFSNENKDKYTLTTSWHYEYAIFNLIHILKMVDWEKEAILFFGY